MSCPMCSMRVSMLFWSSRLANLRAGSVCQRFASMSVATRLVFFKSFWARSEQGWISNMSAAMLPWMSLSTAANTGGVSARVAWTCIADRADPSPSSAASSSSL
eukprot:3260822-Alexandrium_andersonii.AAC.1